jgi:hypothetical protein
MVINTFFCMLLYVLGLLILKDSFFIENIWTPFLKIKNK